MITDGKKWLCLAVKKLSVLVKGITLKHKGDFYCLNYFHLRSTKDRLKKPEDLCENHIYYYVEMPKEYNKILKYNNGKKSIKVPFIIYADLESLLEKMSTCHNNLEKSSTIIQLLVIQCLQIVYLIQQKVSLIPIEVKTV